MSEEKRFGIRAYPRLNPSAGVQMYKSYTIQEWGRENMYAEEMTDEPLTLAEAQALVKLLMERHEV